METAVPGAANEPMPQLPSEPADSAERRYFEYLADGQFMIPQCQSCQRHHFYPRVVCPHCGADALRWVKPSGTGVVYATTTVRTKTSTHNVCLVDLQEGPRLMSSVVDAGDPAAVTIGLRVQARIQQTEDQPLLVFVATGEQT